MSLLEQNITKKRQMDNKALQEPEKNMELEVRNDKEYKFEAIIDSVVYGQQTNNNQMSGLYYLILWKDYLEEENSREPSSAVIYFRKLISTFYKKYPKKSIATSLPLNSTLSIAKSMVFKEPKQKCGRLSKKANQKSRN